MSDGKAHELFKDERDGKKSLIRMILIITFLMLCGFWLKSMYLGKTIEAPGSLMQAFWTAMSFQGLKLGINKFGKDKVVGDKAVGENDGT